MRILFVASGNKGNINIIVENQANSLRELGCAVDYFLIKGKGLLGYFKNIPQLNKYLKDNNYDIIHAHYSLSAIVTSLAGARNIVVSLMGSDAYLNYWMKLIAHFFHIFFWKATIVKTEKMRKALNLKTAVVVPNGVNLNIFRSIDKNESRKTLELELNTKIILFLANPNREEKNFQLAKKSISLLNIKDVELLPIFNIPNSKIPYYLNAADILLLTSKWEGSPNVIKEAMACNLPIVSTDVGDVKKNISNVDGCYITKNDPIDIKEKIKMALNFNKRTNGREKLISLDLDSENIAKKLIAIYQSVLKNENK